MKPVVKPVVKPVGCGASDCWNPVKPGLIPVGDGLRNGRLRNEVCCGKIGDGDRFGFGRVGTKPTIPVDVGTSGLSKVSLAGIGANGPRGALGLNDSADVVGLGLVTNAGGVAEVTGGDTAG